LDAAAEVPNGVALEFMGQPTTFGKLGEGARKLANGLAAQGLKPGESVGLMLRRTFRTSRRRSTAPG